MAKPIRNKQHLQFSVGDVVFIDHKIIEIKKEIHNRIKNHIFSPSIVVEIVEKEDYDLSMKPFSYYVYKVLVGDERLEFSEDVLSKNPIERNIKK